VLATGDHASAQHYLRQSAELNGWGSEEARIALARLSKSNVGEERP